MVAIVVCHFMVTPCTAEAKEQDILYTRVSQVMLPLSMRTNKATCVIKAPVSMQDAVHQVMVMIIVSTHAQ